MSFLYIILIFSFPPFPFYLPLTFNYPLTLCNTRLNPASKPANTTKGGRRSKRGKSSIDPVVRAKQEMNARRGIHRTIFRVSIKTQNAEIMALGADSFIIDLAGEENEAASQSLA
jgi:hypothetical protein